jgi:hypothetical protein
LRESALRSFAPPAGGHRDQRAETFRAKITLDGHDSYEHRREKGHDVLVLVIACAAWVTEFHRGTPIFGRYFFEHHIARKRLGPDTMWTLVRGRRLREPVACVWMQVDRSDRLRVGGPRAARRTSEAGQRSHTLPGHSRAGAVARAQRRSSLLHGHTGKKSSGISVGSMSTRLSMGRPPFHDRLHPADLRVFLLPSPLEALLRFPSDKDQVVGAVQKPLRLGHVGPGQRGGRLNRASGVFTHGHHGRAPLVLMCMHWRVPRHIVIPIKG